MTNEEREDYLKYIENYTINDLADEFNTQNFVIQDKDKFNEILLYYHFKQNEEIVQLQQENQKLKEQVDYLRRSIERKEETITELERERVPYVNEYAEKLENQQKEFINYLTSYIELLSDDPDYVEEGQKEILEEVLLKYKEMVSNHV